MIIQYCSDLHLEFSENKKYIERHPLKPDGEILLLGGDILPLALNHRQYGFFDFVSDNFEAVYWIPGNHEYYGYDAGQAANPLFETIRSNVFLVNNKTIQYKAVNIICSSLWSHISPGKEWVLTKSLADFAAIKMNGGPFLPKHFNQLHETALGFIKGEVSKYAASNNVVLTHHVPTLREYPPRYKNSEINEGFAVELHDYITGAEIAFWLYGHHHYNVAPFTIGNTTMLTNQLGYVRQYEHGSYRKNAVFEI